MFRANLKNLIYFLIPVIPIFLWFVEVDTLSHFKLNIARFVSTPAQIAAVPFNEIKKIIFYHHIFEEYKKEKQKADILRSKVIKLEETLKENERLKKFLNFKRKEKFVLEVASVIGRNPSSWNTSLIIDKGDQEGIKKGQAVINAQGVVGKIVEISPHTSKVILLTDPQFSVAAVVETSRATGVVSGTLQGVCRMHYLDPHIRYSVGEQILTSKLSSSFPEGLLIGEIIKVIADEETSQVECFVKPSISASQLEEVLVVIQ